MGVSLYSKHSKCYDMGYFTFDRLREEIALFVSDKPNNGTIHFLEQSGCDGKLNHRECKELLDDIKDMPDPEIYFGYVGRGVSTCLTIPKFKLMLQECFSHRCNLKWI